MQHTCPRSSVLIVLALAMGCGHANAEPEATAAPPPTTSTRVTPAVQTTVRVFCKDPALWASADAQQPMGAPPEGAVLQVEVPASSTATRALCRVATVAGQVHAYVDTDSLGLVVQAPTFMSGAPVYLRPGALVCVSLYGETPESLAGEATVHLPADWTFPLTPPDGARRTRYTWRGRLPREALAATTPHEDPDFRFDGRLDGQALELLTSDGRVMARGLAPRGGAVILGSRGGLLEVALSSALGTTLLHGFIRPPTPGTASVAASDLEVASGSFLAPSALGLSGTGRGATPTIPQEALPLLTVATSVPLHALVPGAILSLPTGQRLALPDPTYARVGRGGRVVVVFADGTVLGGATVGAEAIGARVLEAESGRSPAAAE